MLRTFCVYSNCFSMVSFIKFEQSAWLLLLIISRFVSIWAIDFVSNPQRFNCSSSESCSLLISQRRWTLLSKWLRDLSESAIIAHLRSTYIYSIVNSIDTVFEFVDKIGSAVWFLVELGNPRAYSAKERKREGERDKEAISFREFICNNCRHLAFRFQLCVSTRSVRKSD